jgi:peptidoglycan hydrolase-like protein with peptidoglycan-binding domain
LPKLKIGYTGNLVYLIQGAFWCKGMSPEAFDGKYTTKTEEAISTLQKNAGVASNGKLTVALLKALFDMSAFVLVPGGDSKIRTMQQNLNASYQPYFGILPCDGIYQRETNTALIYALQAEIGMSPSEANGIYGPGTTSRTPVVNIGATGNVVKIIQWGLYVNGFYKSGDFNGVFSSS